jgi:hypothetical protein
MSRATDINDSRPAVEKVEIRGWIQNVEGFSEPKDSEYAFNVTLDLDWDKSPCAAPGITPINSLDALSMAIAPYSQSAQAWGGPVTTSNGRGNALGGPNSIVIHVEINGWEGRSPPGWNGVWHPDKNPQCQADTPGSGVPPGWMTFDRHTGENNFHTGSHWIFDPSRPPGTPANADLKAGDYVRIVGTLWEDGPHDAAKAVPCWAEGSTNVGVQGRGWFEIHGVDFMAVLSSAVPSSRADRPAVGSHPPEKASTFSVLTLCNGAQVKDWPIDAPNGSRRRRPRMRR